MTRISTILVRRRSAAVAKALMACLIYPRIIYLLHTGLLKSQA